MAPKKLALFPLEDEATIGTGVVHREATPEHTPGPASGTALAEHGPQGARQPANRHRVFTMDGGHGFDPHGSTQ